MRAQDGPQPGLQIRDNMYGDAIIDLQNGEAAAALKIEDAAEESAPGKLREADSWALINNKEGHGMHVTYQVQPLKSRLFCAE